MKFPYAAKGVSKIFRAEVLSLFASIIAGICTVLAQIAMSLKDQNSDTAAIIGLSAIIAVAVAGVLFLIGVILRIIGYLQAAQEEEGIKRAVICTIFSIFFFLGYYLLIEQVGFLGWLSTLFYVIAEILSLLVTIYTILGLMNLSAKCNRPDMIAKGSTILKILIVIYIMSYLVSFITRFFRENAFNMTVVAILAAFTLILSVVLYFFQLYYFGKAKTMLLEN